MGPTATGGTCTGPDRAARSPPRPRRGSRSRPSSARHPAPVTTVDGAGGAGGDGGRPPKGPTECVGRYGAPFLPLVERRLGVRLSLRDESGQRGVVNLAL